eukprot:7813307-Heterocapsa_arctica.AAC.1
MVKGASPQASPKARPTTPKATKFVADVKTGKINRKAVQRDFDDQLEGVYAAAQDDALSELVAYLLEHPQKILAVLKVAKRDSLGQRQEKSDKEQARKH